MAYYSIFPEKDTTIYSHPDRIHMNTGKDEVLELVEEQWVEDAKPASQDKVIPMVSHMT